MVKREELLKVIEKKSETDLVSFVLQCRKEGGRVLNEAISECSKKQLSHIWDVTNSVVAERLKTFADEENVEDQVKLDLIQSLISMMSATIAQADLQMCESMFQTAYLLKDCFQAISPSKESLKNAVAKLFEDWWHKNLHGRQYVVNTTFLYLVEKSVNLSNKEVAAVVNRVWSLHEIILLFDLGEESSSYLKEQLKRCFICPQYVKNEKGIKFLAFILCQDVKFTKSIHSVIKNHLVNAPRSMVVKYGEVYFRAWQQLYKDKDENLLNFEENCIQDLMALALLSQPTVTPALRKVLNYFHGSKHVRGVDEMLYRLYQPLLWRYLKAANYLVRDNAVKLFFDAFPIQNPDLNKEECHELLQTQLDLFQVLLYDPNPSIRQASVIRVFEKLHALWDLFPDECLKNLMKIFINELMYDEASRQVRESIVKGFTLLLNNQLSHLFLKPVLPRIKPLFNDTSENVRVAMIELLKKVKKISAIKFWDIVSLEFLLIRLAHDDDPVCRRIVQLLFDDFVPLDKSGAIQLERCVYLLEENHQASRQFYRLAVVQKHMSMKETVDYIEMINRAILMAIHKAWKKSGGTGHSDDSTAQVENSEQNGNMAEPDVDESDDDGDDDDVYKKLDINNTSLMLRLLEVVYTLWTLNRQELNKSCNEEMKKFLFKRLSTGLIEMDKVFMNKEIVSLIVLLMGYIPTNYIPAINRSWLPKLRNMTDQSEEKEFDAIVESLCEVNRAPDVFELTLDWIKPVLDPDVMDKSSTKQTKKARRVRIMDPMQPQPLLAIKILKFMFETKIISGIIFHDHMQEVWQCKTVLNKSMDRIEEFMRTPVCERKQKHEEILQLSFKLYTLILLKGDKSTEGEDTPMCSLSELNKVYIWAQRHIIPRLNCRSCGVTGDEEGRLSSLPDAIIESLLGYLRTIYCCGLADSELSTQGMEFCQLILSEDSKMTHLQQVIQSIRKNVEFVKFDGNEELNCNMEEKLPSILIGMFVNLSTFIKDHSDACVKTLQSSKAAMADLIKFLYSSLPFTDSFTNKCMATILAAVVAEMVFTSKQYDLEDTVTDLNQLPTLSKWMLEIVQKVPTAMRCFLQSLTEQCVQSGTVTFHTTHAVVHLLLALQSCKCEKAGLKQLHDLLTSNIEQLTDRLTIDDEENDRDTLMSITRKMEESTKYFTELISKQ